MCYTLNSTCVPGSQFTHTLLVTPCVNWTVCNILFVDTWLVLWVNYFGQSYMVIGVFSVKSPCCVLRKIMCMIGFLDCSTNIMSLLVLHWKLNILEINIELNIAMQCFYFSAYPYHHCAFNFKFGYHEISKVHRRKGCSIIWLLCLFNQFILFYWINSHLQIVN